MNNAEQAVIDAFGERTSKSVHALREVAEQDETVKAVSTALRSLERKNVIMSDQFGIFTLYRDQIAIADATHPELEPFEEEYDDYEEIFS